MSRRGPEHAAPAAPLPRDGVQEHARDHLEMIRQQRAKWLWTNVTNAVLGVWLIGSPATFGYESAATAWSDTISGALLACFGALSLLPRLDFAGRWAVCLVGVWLQFAPLLFWAPRPVAYVNDTLVGALAITFSVLVPMMPGAAHHLVMMKPGPEIPPGWTYNPSSWLQRTPIIALAFAGWFISRYLAAVQLGYVDVAWEPFFGEGTMRVLHSEVSRAWPISDAGLGAAAYTFEALMGYMGGQTRWRTMPWMVTFFGILVVPLGITHIVLVILQPVIVGQWCTLCLAAAFLMLLMIPLTLDEVVAMGQFLAQSVREGKPFWWTFWVGGTTEREGKDLRTPRYGSPISRIVPAMLWGIGAPWTLLVSAALGVWLMAAPAVVQAEGPAADSDHIGGALILTLAIIVTAEVARPLRLVNVVVGAWLVVAPWVLAGSNVGATSNDMIIGAAVILLALPRGAIRERYGSWNRHLSRALLPTRRVRR